MSDGMPPGYCAPCTLLRDAEAVSRRFMQEARDTAERWHKKLKVDHANTLAHLQASPECLSQTRRVAARVQEAVKAQPVANLKGAA